MDRDRRRGRGKELSGIWLEEMIWGEVDDDEFKVNGKRQTERKCCINIDNMMLNRLFIEEKNIFL
ncbi:hypothetical protein HPS57_10815 [Prevotella sp. PINT]|uniref:hypothetical protein n=1 Tax=Palleniella intestinalis TaxID=2736291 RepID=UPI001554F42F|nr:hypothetical protein [Palleniella intestinalis]NPD82459.1 hypothetical protein [Palleniella intestinalis]